MLVLVGVGTGVWPQLAKPLDDEGLHKVVVEDVVALLFERASIECEVVSNCVFGTEAGVEEPRVAKVLAWQASQVLLDDTSLLNLVGLVVVVDVNAVDEN